MIGIHFPKFNSRNAFPRLKNTTPGFHPLKMIFGLCEFSPKDGPAISEPVVVGAASGSQAPPKRMRNIIQIIGDIENSKQ